MKRSHPGPDPDFPWLPDSERFTFPSAREAKGNIIAVGGNLSPGMLLSAYEQGIFPWYNEEDPVIWQSPDPRFLIFPGALRISSSMKKILRQGGFQISLDRDFPAVIRGCAETPRPGQDGTWISADIIEAYTNLHRLGWAHSAEAWREGELAGGCYGIRLGRVFAGESMFSLVPNASKAAFLTLAQLLFSDGADFIDCQVPTRHLESLGGQIMPRRAFLALLEQTLSPSPGRPGYSAESRQGNWGELYKGRFFEPLPKQVSHFQNEPGFEK